MSSQSSTPPAKPPTSLLSKAYHFIASFGLATVVLIFLLLVTYLGTLEQVEHGLYESQRKYFESLIITNIDMGCCLRAMHVNHIGPWVMPVLMPGGMLLMAVLTLNMIFGGLIRIRKTGRTFGVIITHGSIVFMLLAGLVSHWYKKDGALSLAEGQSTDEFRSFHNSVIEIERLEPVSKEGKRTALVIPGSQFKDLREGKARTFTSNDLPFDLMVMNYEVNATPTNAKTVETRREIVDGYFLQPNKENPQQEANMDGAYVKITPKKGGSEQKGIISRASSAPLSVKVGEEVYGISMTRETWKLPFSVRLDDFQREVHPGTERARKFTSLITKITDGKEEKRKITMNEPLREGGYALFQASFEMQGRPGAVVEYSTLQVVKNPSDHWPLIAMFVTMAGLLLHMTIQLIRYLSGSMKVPAPKSSSATPPPPPQAA
ncbi:MAG: cytochrome c biogenesis protein ResB [Verrucomicrobium sp.]